MIKLKEVETSLFFDTVVERCAIYVRKEVLNEPAPWTNDPCFKQFRFCNVFRCLDKTFKLLEQLPGNPSTREYWALRNMLRWTANNDLIAHLLASEYELLRRTAEGNLQAAEALIRYIVEEYTYGQGNTLTTGSFIVKRPGGLAGDLYMLKTIYAQTLEMKIEGWKENKRSVKRACEMFQSKFPFCGSFTSYCIASDMMYRDYPLSTAGDLYYYAERGPGGVHGLATLLGHKNGKVSRMEWEHGISYLTVLWKDKGPELVDRVLNAVGKLNERQQQEFDEVARLLKNPMALDVEHWLCEFYKYYRGSAKKKYVYKE